MSSRMNQAPRIDPRIKAVLGSFAQPVESDVESREVKPYLAGLNAVFQDWSGVTPTANV